MRDGCSGLSVSDGVEFKKHCLTFLRSKHCSNCSEVYMSHNSALLTPHNLYITNFTPQEKANRFSSDFLLLILRSVLCV